jgi:putative sterol carrier protein
VREVSSDSTNAEFVLTGTPDTWKKIFSKVPGTRASFMHFALSTGALRFTGPFLTTYAQQVKPWEYLLDIVALKVMGDR